MKNKTFLFAICLLVLSPWADARADEATTTPETASTTPEVVLATTTEAAASTTPDTIMLTIRNGGATAFAGSVNLPTADASDVMIMPTGGGAAVGVPARSLLSVLTTLDTTSDAFDITDLSYSSGFGSFLVNCIAVPSGATPDCYNWTDAINGVYPQVGMDHQLLSANDNAVIFFGPSHRVSLTNSTAVVGGQFTALAEQYDLASGNYVPLAGVTLGVGTANPDFSFTELATSTVDAAGQALFTLNATGTYQFGIKEDYYYPAENVTVNEAPAETPAPEPASAPASGGGGSSGVFFVTHRTFDLENALKFIESKQLADGSFGPSLYSDWATIALASAGDTTGLDARRQYLTTFNPEVSSVTDYERHAMALMSLGINPYTGTSVNYIRKITDAFDGTQIGNPALVNDDIFAIFPLLRAGYATDEEIIKKTVDYIVAQQKPDGSWESSADITAAAIQALALTQNLPGTASAMTKARGYLLSRQQADGGFGSSFATSWVMQSIKSLGENSIAWLKGDYSPEDSLYSMQQEDGGVEQSSADDSTRLWATSYAIPAATHKTWAEILSSFTKPEVTTAIPSAGSGAAPITTVSTTTPPVASTTQQALLAQEATSTTTAIIATSTEPVATPEEMPTEQPPTVSPIAKEVPVKIPSVKPAPITKKLPKVIPPERAVKPLPPAASLATVVPNLPPTPHPVKTLSMLAGLLFIIALL